MKSCIWPLTFEGLYVTDLGCLAALKVTITRRESLFLSQLFLWSSFLVPKYLTECHKACIQIFLREMTAGLCVQKVWEDAARSFIISVRLKTPVSPYIGRVVTATRCNSTLFQFQKQWLETERENILLFEWIAQRNPCASMIGKFYCILDFQLCCIKPY